MPNPHNSDPGVLVDVVGVHVHRHAAVDVDHPGKGVVLHDLDGPSRRRRRLERRRTERHTDTQCDPCLPNVCTPRSATPEITHAISAKPGRLLPPWVAQRPPRRRNDDDSGALADEMQTRSQTLEMACFALDVWVSGGGAHVVANTLHVAPHPRKLRFSAIPSLRTGPHATSCRCEMRSNLTSQCDVAAISA